METKKNNLKQILIAFIIGFFMFALGIGVTYLYFKFNPNSIEQITNITKTEKEVTVNENGIADAVDKVYDAVVTVVNYKNNKAYASGTGFVYKTSDGKAYILTNYHVINGNSKVTVTFTNGEIVDAKVVGGDLYADVAVLSVEESKIISVAEMGSSEDARLGDTAFAVGSPVSSEYGWSVTRGILSGKNRMVTVNLSDSVFSTNNAIMSVLQTDVAINSGNSGGPLCNSNGQVIGITSSKVSSTGVEGIGFAIPIEDATKIATKLENGEEIKRPYIGVSMTELTVAKYYGYVDTNVEKGVFVTEVVDGSPAAKAGIKEKDIILEVNDKEVNSSANLRYELYKNEVGDTVKVKVNRDGKELTLDIKLGTNP